ncbi:copper homeostasis protein CutC [bacterium]|nr:copper homeostasis protein CutC [bacterium]
MTGREENNDRRLILEVGARTVEDVVAAERGGADRAELYSSPLEGAITPSAGLIKVARSLVTTMRLFVMVRPRAGDCLYSDGEFQTIQRDVETAVDLGADGVMCGILTADGNLDTKRMEDVVRRARGKPVVLHRAFDLARDPMKTLEQAIDVGCRYLLTSGQANSAIDGRDLIRTLVERAGDRINIVPGSLITAAHLDLLVRETGAREYHVVNLYRNIPSGMTWQNTDSDPTDPLLASQASVERLSERAVREIREILDRAR